MSETRQQHINNLLYKIAQEQNYESANIKFEPLISEGANYSSLLYTGTISAGGKDDLHLFIKLAAMSKQMREQWSNTQRSVQETENCVYTDIQQAYRRIEDKHQVPEKHRLTFAKYYGADMTPFQETIVLENMAVRGYVTLDRFQSIDWEYASLAVAELAKLHALSVALQRQYPEEYKRINDEYIFDYMTEEMFTAFWTPGVANALKVLTGRDKKRFKKFLAKFSFSRMNEYKEACKLEVLAHGDFRASNLMHRTLEDGSLEIVTIDHQTFHPGSPIPDLLMFIVLGTDSSFREQHYDRLVDFYYSQLSDAMRRLAIDPENTYSRTDFYSELNQKLSFGLVMAVFGLPFICVEVEQAPEITSEMEIDRMRIQNAGSRIYPERLRGVIKDFTKWGVLTN